MAKKKKWDVFISYASEDRFPFVWQVVCKLRSVGLSVWYDGFEIEAGQSLREAIDRGISGSRYGLIVLSKSYFKKLWTSRELDGLMTLETKRSKILLPLWHGVTFQDVRRFSPMVAARTPVNLEGGFDDLSAQVRRVAGRPKAFMTAMGGKIDLLIIPKLGVVQVFNIPEKKKEEEDVKTFDFNGNKVDLGKELDRFEGDFEAVRFQYGERIGLVIAGGPMCDSDEIRRVLIPVEWAGNLECFLPLYVNEYVTVGVMNKETQEARESLGI